MRRVLQSFISLALVAALGCSIASHTLPTTEELVAFESAGPVKLELDQQRLVRGLIRSGSYKLVAGDLVEIRGPAILFRNAGGSQTGSDAHMARVKRDGKIQLPMNRSIQAAGKTVPQLELAIAEEISEFVVTPPSIVAQIKDYELRQVSVLGAVENPGVYELRSDQLNLYSALSEAGGIIKANTLKVGARLIRLRRPGETQQKAFTLPVKGLNIPDENLQLAGGETIEVVRFEAKLVTVLGLVAKPGAYEYPPEQEYSLLQALALAGGVDLTADPPYTTVFRSDAAGQKLATVFEISGAGLRSAASVRIKPGDVIAVQHTAGSWTRSVLSQVLRFQIGYFVDARSL